jgi:hypothetical protein
MTAAEGDEEGESPVIGDLEGAKERRSEGGREGGREGRGGEQVPPV